MSAVADTTEKKRTAPPAKNGAPLAESGRIRNWQRFENIATSIIFLGTILTLGSLTWILKPSKKMLSENRYAAVMPVIEPNWHSLAAFPHKMESFFNDRFALRGKLISARNKLWFTCFNCSGSPDVLFGPNGWLEYRAEHNLESYLNKKPFTEVELSALSHRIDQRRAWLATKGIHYLFLVAPNKSTLYSSMPLAFQHATSRTRLDQILEYLQRHTTVDTIDLRVPLRNAMANSHQLLYWKTDTHWNELGAFTAYQAVCARLKKSWPAIRVMGNVHIEDRQFCGDLAKMAGLQDCINERGPVVIPNGDYYLPPMVRSTKSIKALANPRSVYRISVSEVNSPASPRAVVLHDSFLLGMEPFLSYSLSRSVNLWTYEFPKNIISSERPDIVIEEQVERQLLNEIIEEEPDAVQ